MHANRSSVTSTPTVTVSNVENIKSSGRSKIFSFDIDVYNLKKIHSSLRVYKLPKYGSLRPYKTLPKCKPAYMRKYSKIQNCVVHRV